MRESRGIGDHDDLADLIDDEVEQTIADLRDAFLAPVPDDVAARHLAVLDGAMAELQTDALANQRRRRHRKVAAAVGVSAGFVIATGGLAAAGVLPEPVQRVIATAASPLGIHLPDGSSLRPSSPDGDGN